MKKTISVVILLLYCTLNFCQAKFIEIPKLDLTGYIFDDSYEVRFKISNIDGRFTPNIDEIKVCEELLSHFDLASRKRSKKLKRHYLGFLINNSKFILVHAICYKSDKKFNLDFPNWSNEFSILLEGSDKKQTSFLYVVDVKGKLIGFF